MLAASEAFVTALSTTGATRDAGALNRSSVHQARDGVSLKAGGQAQSACQYTRSLVYADSRRKVAELQGALPLDRERAARERLEERQWDL